MSQYLYGCVFDILTAQATERSDAIAIEDEGPSSISYSRLLELVSTIGRSLRACGVTPGDRIAVVLPNGSTMGVGLLGVTCAATAVPLNPVYRKEEYRSYFDEIGVSFLLTRRGFGSEARSVAVEKGIPVLELLDDSDMTMAIDGRAIEPSAGESLAGRTTGPDDIALVLLTSGSTGRSKKVPLTHRNVCVSVADICRSLALTPSDRCLCMWEQFHVGGLVDLLLVPLASGGSVICAGSFNAKLFYKLLASKQPSWFQGVPTTLHELSAFAKRTLVDPAAAPLRFIRSVASSLSPGLMEEIEVLFGVPVVQTFGMTEAGPLITTNLLPPGRRKPGSVGPSCGPDIRIVAPDGTLLDRGETGEIVVRGPNVISGYEDAPEANLRSFRDGWFHTGDTGYLDGDDYLFLKGRLKEMINRGGEKITPQEIDDVLLTHPSIAQAASFSIKHPTLGEDVGVAVVPKASGLTEAEIRAFVGERLAAFKVPQKVLIIDAMPRDPIGKINRLTLATLANSREKPVTAEEPANEVESRVAQIWASELNLEQVGLDVDFFALGGDSLSAVRIALAVEEAFGRALSGDALLGSVTVRQMSKWISDKAESPQSADAADFDLQRDTLSASQVRIIRTVMSAGKIPTLRPDIPIKAVNMNGSRKPIVWCFNRPSDQMERYASYLDPDQPMLGLFSGSRLLPFTEETIKKTARYYADELAKLYPDGQFILGGNCHGSRVAHHIVKIFAEDGVEIEQTFLIDYFDQSLFEYPGRLLMLFSKQSRHRAFMPLLKWGLTGWRSKFRKMPSLYWISGEHGFQVDVKTMMTAVIKFAGEDYEQSQIERSMFYLNLGLLGLKPIFWLNVRASRVARWMTSGNQKNPVLSR